MSIETGRTLGRYKVVSSIGKGGMGEVYLAEDTELGRQVALKVLLDDIAKDEDRVRRFVQEAKAASALNHPNILTVYEIGNDGDTKFIATELIKGETLRDRLRAEPLTLREVLDVAMQAAAALNAAHNAGIVHRDIKPENIMLRDDGFAKVLDFGLAKLAAGPAGTADSEDTTRAQVNTQPGVVMGTAPYMSPEQTRGKATDARCDIWSLGIVMYEMLTKRTPFSGETANDSVVAILTKDPPRLDASVPSELQRIIRKSLQKNVDERYQTVKDLLLDVKNLKRELEITEELERSQVPHATGSANVSTQVGERTTDEVQATQIRSTAISTETSVEIARVKQNYRRGIFAVIGILLLVGLGYFGYVYLKPRRLIETSFKNTTVEKLPIDGIISSVAFSPDQKYLAYVKGESLGKMSLILRQMATGSEKEIQATENVRLTLSGFSHDGSYFYYRNWKDGFADLYQVPLLGGESKKVVVDIDSEPSFLPDDKEFVYLRHSTKDLKDSIIQRNLFSGEEKVIYSIDGNFDIKTPTVSPDGARIAFVSGNRLQRPALIPINGGEPKFIGNDTWDAISGMRWLSDGSGLLVNGYLAKAENTKLFLVDLQTGTKTDLTKDGNDYSGTALSYDNKTIATIRTTPTSGIGEYDIASKTFKQIKRLGAGYVGLGGIGIKPDNQIIYTKTDGKGNLDLWKINTDGTADSQFLSLGKFILLNNKAEWGDVIYFHALDDKNQSKIWKANLDGSNPVQLTRGEKSNDYLIGVVPQTKTLLYGSQDAGQHSLIIFKVNLEGGETTPLPTDKNVSLRNVFLSPDGKKIGYIFVALDSFRNASNNFKFAVADFDGTQLLEVKIFDNFAFGRSLRFSADGKNLLFTKPESPSDIWQKDLSSGAETKVTNFGLDTIFNFTASDDGKKIYVVRGNTTSEVVLIKTAE
ncbi:MAG: protein kinase [Acidobacteriota bacterium]